MYNSLQDESNMISFAEWGDNHSKVVELTHKFYHLQNDIWKKVEGAENNLTKKVKDVEEEFKDFQEELRLAELYKKISNVQQLTDDVDAMKDEIQCLRREVRVLREMKTQEFLRAPDEKALEEFTTVVYQFNKSNRKKTDEEKVRFGNNLSMVTSVPSLRQFLVSDHAKYLGLRQDAVEFFSVFVKDGKLVTMDPVYKGGVGFGVLWIPSNKYVRAPSDCWESVSTFENDPRRMFLDPQTKALWVPLASDADDVYGVSPPMSKRQKTG